MSIKNNNGQTAEMLCQDQATLKLIRNHGAKSHADIKNKLRSVQDVIKMQLETTNDSQEDKQKYFDLITQSIIDSMRIIQDNLDKANNLNGMAPMLFEIANLLTAIDQENNIILNNASSANREAAGALRYEAGKRIIENFQKTENTSGPISKSNEVSLTSSGLSLLQNLRPKSPDDSSKNNVLALDEQEKSIFNLSKNL